jgi:hypothetical protein
MSQDSDFPAARENVMLSSSRARLSFFLETSSCENETNAFILFQILACDILTYGRLSGPVHRLTTP